MSQPVKRKNKSLLDFYSKKSRDDSTENVTVCRDVKAASSVSAELRAVVLVTNVSYQTVSQKNFSRRTSSHYLALR